MPPRRRNYDRTEKALLQFSYDHNGRFPNSTEISSLATLLDVSERNVRVWFQNQRQRSLSKTIHPDVALTAVLLAGMYPTFDPSVVAWVSLHTNDDPMYVQEKRTMLCDYIRGLACEIKKRTPNLTYKDSETIAMYTILEKTMNVMK